MPAIKFSVKHILTQNLLPGGADGSRGGATPFTFYVCKDTGAVFVSDAAGSLLNISDLLLGKEVVRSFPTQGAAGRDGAPGASITGAAGARGEKGDRGDAGTAGPPSDRGPAGQSIRGEQGQAGPDSAAVLAQVRQEMVDLKARIAPLTDAFAAYITAQTAALAAQTEHRLAIAGRIRKRS